TLVKSEAKEATKEPSSSAAGLLFRPSNIKAATSSFSLGKLAPRWIRWINCLKSTLRPELACKLPGLWQVTQVCVVAREPPCIDKLSWHELQLFTSTTSRAAGKPWWPWVPLLALPPGARLPSLTT